VSLVGALGSVTLAGFLGGTWWFFDLFAHFRLQYAGALLLLGPALWLFGRGRWAAVALACGFVNVAVVAPQLVVWPSAKAANDGGVRFVFANVHVGNPSAEPLLDFLDETQPDVILLAEIDARWERELGVLASTYPYRVVEARPHGRGLGLWSRKPIVTEEIAHFVDKRLPSIVARLEDGLLLIGTHPLAPGSARRDGLRNGQLQAIAEMARAEEGPVIVLGDLNTTPWGYGFRSLMGASGLKDSSRGRGLQWTWPSWFPPLAIPIDHALVSQNIQVLHRFTGPNIGSDHFPLVVDVRLPE
jgi:endonuclease/exonuclease/phosphatase (EEP) superfamily protein YafD